MTSVANYQLQNDRPFENKNIVYTRSTSSFTRYFEVIKCLFFGQK